VSAGEKERADAVVARRLGISARAARKLFDGGNVTLAGRRLDKGSFIDATAEPEIEGTQEATEPVLQPRAMHLAVLFEDSTMVAVNKPAGIPSHPLRPDEGDTVAAGIVSRYPECFDASEDAREGGLCHRLDTGTSGVIVAARSRESWLKLRKALSSGLCTKTYLAHVQGAPPLSFSVDGVIGRGGKGGSRAMVNGGRDPLPARTVFDRLWQRESSALVRATLGTGRIHQVRVHLAHSGHPILGDDLYSMPSTERVAIALGIQALRLHAESITLTHPDTGATLRVAAPAPTWAA
jgi:23S rRNA pseudouridine1911/1915/1917 synthase